MKPITIHKIQDTGAAARTGVIFWWSNILGSFQLRVHAAEGEIVTLRQMHIEREGVEIAARTLATTMQLDVFEIEIEQIDLPGQVRLPRDVSIRVSQLPVSE